MNEPVRDDILEAVETSVSIELEVYFGRLRYFGKIIYSDVSEYLMYIDHLFNQG